MSQRGTGTLNCKIRVRNYVLVANPSRWGQKVDRAVVQSPMLEIKKHVSRVPVKRNKGEEQNAVDFLARDDIEKYSCPIYEKLYVKKDEFEVDAHGVALFSRSIQPSEATLEFKRGDRFWICVGANTHEYQTTVPVINLRTYERGTVPINSVCWFPRIEGPDGELWTLGGETRKLKQTGVKNFSYWSWVICQRLDGSSPVTKSVQIPSKYVTKDGDQSFLSAAESQLLFEKRRSLMLEERAHDSCNVGSDDEEQRAPSTSSTPPLSPASDTSMSSPESVQTDQEGEIASRQMQALKRVLAHAGNPTQLKRLRPSPIHLELRSNILLEVDISPELRDEILDSLPVHPWKARNNHIPNGRSSTQQSQTEDVNQARSGIPVAHDLVQTSYDGQLNSVPDGCTLTEEDSYDVYYAQRKQQLATGGLLPSDRIHNASLCDHKDETCQYSKHWTIPHFHAPPEKCVRESRIYTFSTGNRSNRSGAFLGKDAKHEHCIYREAGKPSTCILEGWKHQCCYWSEEDRLLVQAPATGVLEVSDLPKVPGDVVDLSEFVRLPHAKIDFQDVGLDAQYLDAGGMAFWKDLEAGGFGEGDCMELPYRSFGASHRGVTTEWKGWWEILKHG